MLLIALLDTHICVSRLTVSAYHLSVRSFFSYTANRKIHTVLMREDFQRTIGSALLSFRLDQSIFANSSALDVVSRGSALLNNGVPFVVRAHISVDNLLVVSTAWEYEVSSATVYQGLRKRKVKFCFLSVFVKDIVPSELS